MKISYLLQTVTPLSFYGISAGYKDRSTDINNTQHHTHNTMVLDFSPDPEIRSIHYRAQDVKPGGLFVAVEGLDVDGHDFIDEELIRGASAIITQKPVDRKAIIIEVENTRKTLATISSQFYSNPSEKLFLIGITGTNGKTTTALLVEHLLLKAGMKVGVIGTLNYRYSGKTFENPMTTPESLDLQKILAEMLRDGVTHVVIEVTSHAIDLDRIYNCRFDLGVFTNLSQDHLDYHGEMSSYWSCKKRMFTEILDPEDGKGRIFSVLNSNDEKGRELIKTLEAKFGGSSVLSVGFSDINRVRPLNFQHDLKGISATISTPVGSFEFKSPLVGKYNLENILCSIGVGVALDLSPATIKEGIEAVCAVPGRLERIPNRTGRFVCVDYAHTPDALENVLYALRPSAEGRIICLFGCGGDRDKAKRPLMGQISARLSDLSIVTSDNPRTEQPMEIIDQILLGIQKETSHAYNPLELKAEFQKKGYVVEPDRRKAIQLAISVSIPGDTVLIAGKGNETVQIIGNQTYNFDDRKEAEAALSALDVQRSESKVEQVRYASVQNPDTGTINSKPKILSPIPWTTKEILRATGGELICGDLNHSFSGISIDSRRILANELFVAIKGDVHDGHSFIDDVLRHGVEGCLISMDKIDTFTGKEWQNGNVVCIGVRDTIRALGDLAAFNRKRSNASVVAITGSNGKTTTRKMAAGVVSRCFNTLSTSGNLNNEIGLPLMLLNLSRSHEWAVLEMGMNRPGEIERLAEICTPDVGVITNIGPAHLEGLGSLDAVMKAKGELLGKIKPAGTAVLNADDPRLLHLAKDVSGNVLLFGLSKNAAVRSLSVKEQGMSLSFTLALPSESISVNLKTPASFMVSNALAASAVGYCIGLTAEEIRDGLTDFEPVKGRMNIIETRKGIKIIDDTYNANPGSMEAAIETLKSLKENNRGILVAGDMLELGKHSASLHRKIGSISAESDISKLYATGEFAEALATGAMEEGMDHRHIFIGAKEEILNDIINWLGPNDWVLVKGSRGMAMESTVEGLREWADRF